MPHERQDARRRPRIPAVALLVGLTLPGLAATPVAASDACGLLRPGSDAALSRDCAACHGRESHAGHPYDFAYSASSSSNGPSTLRLAAEAVRRGIFLPAGEVRCVTCHDGRSPWRHRIRLPPGARVAHAVDRTRRVTYENRAALPPVRPGDAVALKPLCLGCHAMD